jgi:F0F1-type ATP synthase assembly protein I
MGVIIAVFTYAGKYLDQKYPVYPNLFTIILSLLGIGGSLYMVIREVLMLSKNEENNDKKQ